MNINRIKSGLTGILNNKIVKILIPIIIICAVCFAIYMGYQRILEHQEKEPVFIRTIQNAKKSHHISGHRVPLPQSGSAYTFMVWLNVTDWDYRRNEWKHVFHKGDFNGGDCQPGVWINPKTNNLTIRFNTRAGKIIYENKKGFPEYLRTIMVEANESEKEGDGTLNSFNDKYKSSLLFVKDNNEPVNTFKDLKKMYSSAESIIIFIKKGAEVNDQVVPFGYVIIKSRSEMERLNSSMSASDTFPGAISENIEIITSSPASSLPSLSPMSPIQLDNIDEISNDVYNIPLNRWFHLAIVGNDLSTSTYIDGYLYNSKPMPSFLQHNNGDLFVTQNGGFGGALTQLKYYGRAMSAKEIYRTVSFGPNAFVLPDLKALFNAYKPKFKVNLKMNVEVNGVDVGNEIKKKIELIDKKTTAALNKIDS